jgi:hypothetical protein
LLGSYKNSIYVAKKLSVQIKTNVTQKSVPVPAHLVCKKRKEKMHSLNTNLSYPYMHIIKTQWGVLPKNLICMLIPNLGLTMDRSAT